MGTILPLLCIEFWEFGIMGTTVELGGVFGLVDEWVGYGVLAVNRRMCPGLAVGCALLVPWLTLRLWELWKSPSPISSYPLPLLRQIHFAV